MEELRITLFENGRDFIERSIYSYDEAKKNPNEYKYALLLLGIGVELILKRILEVEHPLFLLEKIEEDGKTVPFERIIKRIKVVYKEKGTRIKNEDVQVIEAIRNIRNNIIHKEVTIKEEPAKLFSQTLFTLDRMVKIFLDTTLSSTISNWKHVVSDETIKRHYYKEVKGIKIDGLSVPCPMCSLEVLVNKDDNVKCHHCETTYPNIISVLYSLDDDSEFKDILLDAFARDVLKKNSLHEKLKAIREIPDPRMKNKVINELIDEVQNLDDVTFDCPECGEVDYLIYDKDLDGLVCVECGQIDSSICKRCKKNSLLLSNDGADFCLNCRENTAGVCCDCCQTEIFSSLSHVKIDVIESDKFRLPLVFSGQAFIDAEVCHDCLRELEFYESKGIIEML